VVAFQGALSARAPRTIPITLVLTVALLAAGCTESEAPLYRWGNYESLIYNMYVNPGEAEPGVQIAKLSEDIQRTNAEGKRIPPGIHAHLGYMYYTQGNQGEALQEFALERELYPESAVFIDGMLSRMKNR
jgi:hypothetical protein